MRRGPRIEQMPMLHRFSFLRLCFLVWAPSSRQATADAWREGQWRPSPLARSRVVFLRLCGKGGREREKSNKARKKRKKGKSTVTSSPRGVGEQRGKKNSGAFALSPLLAPHFFLPSRIAPRLGRRKKKVFCLSLKKEATMPYVSSPDDGTQIWYELVDELKEAESGGAGAGAEASPSASSPQGGGGSSSTSDDGAAAAAAKPTLSRRKRPWAWAPPLAAGARRSTPSPSPACERRRCCSITGAWASRAALARRSRTRRRPWPGTSWRAW
jgi:hypothetical protein